MTSAELAPARVAMSEMRVSHSPRSLMTPTAAWSICVRRVLDSVRPWLMEPPDATRGLRGSDPHLRLNVQSNTPNEPAAKRKAPTDAEHLRRHRCRRGTQRPGGRSVSGPSGRTGDRPRG